MNLTKHEIYRAWMIIQWADEQLNRLPTTDTFLAARCEISNLAKAFEIEYYRLNNMESKE